MTITEERPVASPAAPPEPSLASRRDVVLNSADHKPLGLIWMGASVLFLFFGLVVGELLQIALAAPGRDVVGDQYGALFSLHATGTALLFLAPLWLGLGTYLLPLQIGATKLALPRAHALATWSFVAGGVLFLVSYLVGTPTTGGLSVSQPMRTFPNPAHADVVAASMWAAGLLLVAGAMVIASASLVATMTKLRAPGMTMSRVPMFAWGTTITAAVTLLTTPMFMAGLILLYLDQHYGGSFFAPDANPVAGPVWQHTLWLFGRPEIYLLLLPGLGAFADVMATHLGRPIASGDVTRGALVVFGGLSLSILTASAPVNRAVLLPTPAWPTVLLGGPLAVVVLTVLATARFGPPKAHISIGWMVGGVLLIGGAGAAAVVAAASPVQVGTAWTTANIHTLAFGAPTLLALGAVYHWAPKLFGKSLSQAAGGLALLLVLAGFAAIGVAGYVAGYQHVAWQSLTDPHLDKGLVKTLNGIMAAGGVAIAAGILIVTLDALRARFGPGRAAPDDPFDGLTLEWATSSPPPPANFVSLPEIRSDAPLADLRAGSDGKAS